MKFENVEFKEGGSVEFNVKCSPQEVTFLVDYAVQNLLKEGIISLHEHTQHQEVELQGVAH
jgi:ribosome biogenesis SPOUT family RNA methylase Rps3